ncbi:MAG: hypothetical protein AB7F35_16925 [Acetobacteraceae bacterium]
MIRILEIALFLAPLLAFAAWRLLFPRAELSPRVLIATGAALAVMFGLLAWMRQEDAHAPGTAYVPSELHDGRITEPRSLP